MGKEKRAKSTITNDEQPLKIEKVLSEAAESYQEERYDFDTWYTLRVSKIPSHHYKEILKADFKARGIKDLDTLDNFDIALKKYGVNIN